MSPATTERPAGGRILVALEASPRSLSALATAGALAAELGAELAGLFVEDINLQHLLALPFAREFCLLSGALRPLSQAEVEHAWRREAEILQRRLAEAAGQRQLRWSFQVTRGRMAVEVDTRIEAFDLVVLGSRAGVSIQAAVRRPLPAQEGPVLVLFDAGRPDSRLLDIGIRLARRSGTGIVLLIHAGDEAGYRSTCTAAQAALKTHGTSGRCTPLPVCGRASLARAVRRETASCLVMGDHNRIFQQESLEKGLDQIECPVVLIR